MSFIVKSILVILLLDFQVTCAAGTSSKNNLTKKEFLALAIKNTNSSEVQKPETKTLWLDKKIQSKVSSILDHNYPKLRLRYQQIRAEEYFQTVWFLDEIGKERPISFAVSVINNRVDLIRVLTFRESRGGEIQMQAFSQQFDQVGLNSESLLDKNIDGITGATMSVSAMKKITRLAIILHRIVSTKELSK